MKRNPMIAALAALLMTLGPVLAYSTEWKDGLTPTNGLAPAAPAIGVWDGSVFHTAKGDADGNLYTRPVPPGMQVIQVKSNQTLADAATDTSFVPFQTSQYRQMYFLLRIKAATFAATGAVELAIKSNTSATADSTSLGWWYQMGSGQRGARVAMTTTLLDRWKMIAISDSTSGIPYWAPYSAVAITNKTSKPMIYDLFILGVPW